MAREFMSDPKPMHFVGNPMAVESESAQADARAIRLEVSMTVTSYGSVRNVEVLNPPEAISEDMLRDIKKQVKTIPFRPAMKEGEVVTTKEFIWRLPVAAEASPS